MRTMYDSTDPFAIPSTAPMVAGYVTGPYAWPQSGWDRFAGKPQVRITIDNSDTGNCLDVEQGDAWPALAPPWAWRRRAAGVTPWVYCSESAWQSCKDAFAAAGVPEPLWWIAWYQQPPRNTLDDVPGAVAKQFANSQSSGGNYDLSCVQDYIPGFDYPLTLGDTMGPYNTGQGVYWLTLDGQLLPVQNPGNNQYTGVDGDDLNAMAAAQQKAYAALIAKISGSISGTITGTIS